MLFVGFIFPIVDIRPFLPHKTNRLSLPSWPFPRPNTEFVRGFGSVRSRNKGGLPDWSAEDVYCSAAKAIRFRQHPYCYSEFEFKCKYFGLPDEIRWYPRCLYRRFYSDGYAVNRIEVGFRCHARYEQLYLDKPNGEDVLRLVNFLFELPIRIPSVNENSNSFTLLNSSQALAKCYLRSSTSKKLPAHVSTADWWITDCPPLAIIEYKESDISNLPTHNTPVTELKEQEVELSHCWIEKELKRVSLWFLKKHKLANKRYSQGFEPDRLNTHRRLRIHLSRLHAENECLKQVIRYLGQKKWPLEIGTDGSENLQFYLRNALRRLKHQSSYGFAQSSLLAVAQEARELVSEGERIALLSQLEKIRQNIFRNVKDFTAPKFNRAAKFYFLGNENSITVGEEILIGGKCVSNYEIKFGDHCVNTGNVGREKGSHLD